MRWALLLILAILACVAAPRAEANTTCSVTSITSLSFGPVDPTSTTAMVDTTATLNYTCVYSGTLGILYGSFITMCGSLGPDSAGAYAPRTMQDPLGDRMQFQVYSDPGRSTIWGTLGNVSYPAFTFTKNIGILSDGANISGSVTIYGRIPAAQALLSPGTYTGTIGPNSITYSYNEVLLNLGNYPTTCNGGGTGGPKLATAPNLAVQSSVAAACTFGTATDLNFGNVSGLLRTATDQNAIVRVACTNRAVYQLGLDNGQNASGTTRRMSNGTRFVNYELYQDSARTTRWGNTLNTDTLPQTGNANTQAINVYGRVPAQTAVPAGAYSDVIKVTITY